MKLASGRMLLVVVVASSVLSAVYWLGQPPAPSGSEGGVAAEALRTHGRGLDAAVSYRPRSGDIRRDTFKGQWPFVTGWASLTCRSGPAAGSLLLTATLDNGKEYALNGVAAAAGYPQLGEYQSQGSGIFAGRVPLKDVAKEAERLCLGRRT